MSSATCLCGHTTMAISGDPQMKALCHCTDCQKISGSTYSTNIIFNEGDIKWNGQTPKSFTMKAPSGRPITNHFCADCGSTLARTGDAFPGSVIVKAGTMPGALTKYEPGAELFVGDRPSWVAPFPNAQQAPGMP